MDKVTFLVLVTTMIVTVSSISPPSVLEIGSDEKIWLEDSEQILCNVIVRATHDLQVNEKKSIDQINTYLIMDCQKLPNEELIEQCNEMVKEHLNQIFEYVTNGTTLSQICKQIDDFNQITRENEREDQCSSNGGDKCQCCMMHVKKRKMRYRYIIKQMAKKRLHMCEKSPEPERCRHWIRRKEQRALKRINRICPFLVCKHLGYCEKRSQSALDSSSVWSKLLLDQQLQSYVTSDVCNQFRSSQPLCIQLLASSDAHRFANLYLSILHNDRTWIDRDLQQIASQVNLSYADSDTCMACKNVIESSMDFYKKNLETVGQTLDSISNRHMSIGTDKPFLSEERTTIDGYLQALKPTEFCVQVQLCVSDTVGQCQSCVQRFQSRKDAAMKAIDRLLASQANIFPNQQFLSEVLNEVRTSINEFDLGEACAAMGLCGDNAIEDIKNYEAGFVEEIGKGICSMLSPLDTLCQQIIEGRPMDIQTMNLNSNDLYESFMRCQIDEDEEINQTQTTDQCSNGKDHCQCCIHRVMEKKKCWKRQVAKYISHMIRSCRQCPAREKCERYWQEKKACWDAKIDKICPMRACIRMGYCKRRDQPTSPVTDPQIME